MHNLQDKLTEVLSNIEDFAHKADRSAKEIRLLAVSKTQSAEKVRQAYEAGQRDFGENYLQEALEKQATLGDCDITWHFIGPVQSNKTRAIAESFSWLHSLERAKIADRLSRQRPKHLEELQVCIQVNVDDEASKAGVAQTELEALALRVCDLPGLRLRGLMCIPSTRAPQSAFARMRRLLQELNRSHANLNLDTLSMGMSNDVEMAIAEGATIVRIGTAIFGERR